MTSSKNVWTVGPDTEIEELISEEKKRQETSLQLIASENFASPAVMKATGSVFTNKYSEGYPRRRYYGGNAKVDVVEQLAIDRVKELFGAEHANVQPHSGSQANAAVYMALLDVGDTVMGMSLDHGGHLTHGSPVNASGRFYNFISYGLTGEDERIDYEEMRSIALAERPKLIVAGATAYPRRIDPEPFRQVCDEIGAYFMFDAAHIAGLIAGGQHPNPVPHADVVTFTTHKTLRGPRGGCILSTEALAKKIDSAVFPGNQGGPLEHVIAAKAIGFREAMDAGFADYAKRIVDNACALADALADQGFRLVSGGTDNHLLLLDLRSFDENLTGKEAQEVLDQGGVTLNRNTIPDDPRSPFVTSGVRMGVASVTTQGMGAEEMVNIADFTARILRHRDDDSAVNAIAKEVAELCAQYPPYPDSTRQ
ncbi:MAG: serine hydroxymethyltransferase [Acidimicrobiaceae bacterium]|nr:serine hydroxymethyltransferase [Acidimicrobiaceae bacterium]|tara:strand:+ start:38973 stop:40244 length:1272 start_codon:yes stop_codon:yes gene_type:complete